MKFFLLRWVVVLAVGVASLSAQVVTYYVTGTVDDILLGKGEDVSLFGVRTAPAVLHAALTFDLTAHPHVGFVPTGGTLDGRVAARDFYVFPMATLVAATVTFGTQTWTVADLEVDAVGATEFGLLADTALTTVPSHLVLSFRDASNNVLVLGGLNYDSTVDFNNRLSLTAGAVLADGSGTLAVSAVPEPATYAAMLGVCALIGVGICRRRKRR